MRNNGTADILRKFISILLSKLLHLVCLGHTRHDAPLESRSQLAALLTSGSRVEHWFATHERFLPGPSDFMLLRVGVNKFVTSQAAGIKPLHEKRRVARFWFRQSDYGIPGCFHAVR